MAATAPVYHPRGPTDSPLWKILLKDYDYFKIGCGEHCEKHYGFFRPVVDEVVEEYLRCTDLHEGFARVRCTNPQCKNEYLLAFSCKGRWFCPSCHRKKTIQFGEEVTNNIPYPVPHRQLVFTIPIMLRIYFKYDRKLQTQLCHCAKDSLNDFLSTVLGLPDGILLFLAFSHNVELNAALRDENLFFLVEVKNPCGTGRECSFADAFRPARAGSVAA